MTARSIRIDFVRSQKREYRFQDRERAFLQMRQGLKPVAGPLGTASIRSMVARTALI